MLQTTKPINILAKPSAEIESFDAVVFLCNKAELDSIMSGSKLLMGDESFALTLIGLIKKSDFNAFCGEMVGLNYYSKQSSKVISVVLVGYEKKPEKELVFNNVGFDAATRISKAEEVLVCPSLINTTNQSLSDQELVMFSVGMAESKYAFINYITDEAKKSKMTLTKNIVIAKNIQDSNLQEANILIDSIFMVRDLVNTPANDLFPESYADYISDVFKKSKEVDVKVLDEKDLKKLAMGMLLAVAQASINHPRVVILKYMGNPDSKDIDLCLLGKGVTFDSGGLSLKPANYMIDMKTDMAGSATVVGCMKVLSETKAKVNVIGAVGLVENSVGSNAQRPGDIVKSFSGKTVEVLNTDAEGRMVLGDILTYCKQKYEPKHMIDFATLTGAVLVAIGNCYAGLFSNSDSLASSLIEAGEVTGERSFRFPMGEEYDKMIDSKIADMKNISNTGYAGSITAAQFLKRFILDHKSWAHIDIAGTAYLDKNEAFSNRKGSTGYGVKLVNQLVKQMFKQ